MLRNNGMFPQEFYNFLQHFYGIPIDFSNPKIDFSEEEFDYVTSTLVEFGDASECKVLISYISEIDYKLLKKDYINNNDEIVKSVKFLEAFGEEQSYIEHFFKDFEEKIKTAKKWSEKVVPCDFKGYVVTPDLAISLKDNLIQAMIISIEGEFTILYGTLDSNGRLNDITVSSFDIFDFADNLGFNDSFMGFDVLFDKLVLFCDTLMEKMQYLESIGIYPNEKVNVHFNQILDKVNLENMSKSPLGAIYHAKQFLLNEIFENDNLKEK